MLSIGACIVGIENGKSDNNNNNNNNEEPTCYIELTSEKFVEVIIQQISKSSYVNIV